MIGAHLKPQILWKRLVVTFLWALGMYSFNLIPNSKGLGDLFLFSMIEVALFSIFSMTFDGFMLEYVIKDGQEVEIGLLILFLISPIFYNGLSFIIVSKLYRFHFRLFHYLLLEGLAFITLTAKDKRGTKNG